MVLRAYKTRRILLFWSLFIGVSAIYGSLMMFIDPSGRLLGMDKMLGYFEVLPLSEYLYQDYVFPGIALLVINGITNLYASYLIIRNKKLGDILGMVFGMTLMVWITIQFIIFPFNVMSTAYFIFGFLQFITGYMTLVFRKQEEFKFNIDDYPYINPESTTLVVYFSRMGYTRKIAYEIANRKRCAIYEIKTQEDVSGTWGFFWCGRYGMEKSPMTIEDIRADLNKYFKVIIVSPIWVFDMAAPVRAFLMKAKGQIKEVNYVLLHHAKGHYLKVADRMDMLLGLRHARLTNIISRKGEFRIYD